MKSGAITFDIIAPVRGRALQRYECHRVGVRACSKRRNDRSLRQYRESFKTTPNTPFTYDEVGCHRLLQIRRGISLEQYYRLLGGQGVALRSGDLVLTVIPNGPLLDLSMTLLNTTKNTR